MAQTIEDLKNHRHDIVYCVNKDIEFHDILVQATNNRVFGVMLESLAELSRESRLKTMRMSGIDKPIAEHRAILEAIKARDPENAIICMQKHLQTAELNLKEMANSKPRLSDDKLDKLKVLK
jgi:DNA-binding FadR family transcriptional regulator